MDPLTLNYYEENAGSIFAQHSSGRSGVEKYFRLAFPPGSEILDIGAGSGRDMDILLRDGYEPYGAEPSLNMLEARREQSWERTRLACAFV
jgi:hypothetical protein